MRGALLTFLVFGLGAGGVFWFVWDYVRTLRAQVRALESNVRELEDRNAELVLALEDRRDAAAIDEAIRRGRLPR